MNDELDPQQAAAARAPQGRAVVSAGAGTGKTRVLVHRTAHLVRDHGMHPSSIVAVTFTNRAAGEMRERLAILLGPEAQQVRAGTFHSLSSRILRRHAHLAGLRDGGFRIVDESDAAAIVRKVCLLPNVYGPYLPDASLSDVENASLEVEHRTGLDAFAKHAQRRISLFKAWGLTDVEAGDPDRPPRSDDDERLASAYCAYQYELESENACDFGDLILKVVRLFERYPEILASEAARVRHMLVDEAQDANPVQVRWVRLLTSVHDGVTAVGDEDQNIYAFNGGYPGAMTDMVGEGAKHYALETNRRCTDEILRHANLAVDCNRRKERKRLRSGRSGALPVATGHPSQSAEAAYVAKRIGELIERGVEPSEIAVLVRSAYLMRPVEEALVRTGIASKVTKGSSLLDREEIRDVLAYLRLAVDPRDEAAFRRVANRPVRGLGPQAVDAVVDIALRESLPFHDACRHACEKGSSARLRPAAREGAARLSATLATLDDDGAADSLAWDTLDSALRSSGYLEWLAEQKDGGAERAEMVQFVVDLSDGDMRILDFVDAMSLMTDADPSPKGKVRISTMHASKGLEFDHVFCVGLADGVMPSGRAIDEGRQGKAGDRWNGPSAGGVEEERRIGHVAFTRARHTLEVTFPWQVKRGGSGRSRSAGPSAFVEECAFSYGDMVVGDVRPSRKAGKANIGYDR